MKSKEPKLGDRVKDKVSGLQGIVTGRAMWLNGCVQFLMRPKALPDNKFPEGVWLDGVQLTIVQAGAVPFMGPKDTGGMEQREHAV